MFRWLLSVVFAALHLQTESHSSSPETSFTHDALSVSPSHSCVKTLPPPLGLSPLTYAHGPGARSHTRPRVLLPPSRSAFTPTILGSNAPHTRVNIGGWCLLTWCSGATNPESKRRGRLVNFDQAKMTSKWSEIIPPLALFCHKASQAGVTEMLSPAPNRARNLSLFSRCFPEVCSN